MSGVSNEFVYQVMHRTVPTFRGVYSSDLLPRKNYQTFPASMIVNLSKHSEINGHFIAIYQTKNHLMYMDSLGFQPWVPALRHFIERAEKIVHYNTTVQVCTCNMCQDIFLDWNKLCSLWKGTRGVFGGSAGRKEAPVSIKGGYNNYTMRLQIEVLGTQQTENSFNGKLW